MASAVFTLPPIGTVGLSEADARGAGARCDVYEADFTPDAATRSPAATSACYMKLVVDDAERPRAGGAHARRRRAGDRAEPRGGDHRGRDQGATSIRRWRCIPTAAEEFVLLRAPARRVND